MSLLSRRSFFKTAAALGTLPLTLNASDAPTDTLKLIHITDSHMDLGDSDSVDAMKLMVTFINTHYKDLDLVLFGGDNFNNNSAADSDALAFKKIVDKLHCPYYSVRGNKESSPKGDAQIDGERFYELFVKDRGLVESGNDWKLEKNGIQILGLDSCIDHQNNGRYTPSTLRFAKKALQTNKPTLMLNHHPYTNYWKGSDPKDIHKYVLNNTQEVQKQLFSYKNLLVTLSGHKHIDSVTTIQGTKVIVTRGFVRPIDLDNYPMRYLEISPNSVEEKLIYTS